MLIAVTGATGFIGRHVVAALCAAGHGVRALSRRDAPDLEALGATLVHGDLQQRHSLTALLAGVDAVVHAAGAILAPDGTAYATVNAAGAANVAEALAEGRLLVHVSSLAAREPGISVYAASKAQGERLVLEQTRRLHIVVVRPPAVYGPGDRSTLPIFRAINRGWLLHPAEPAARFSLLYASELAQLIVALLEQPPASGTTLEPDDGTPGGYAWAELATIAQTATGRRVRAFGLPKPPLAVAAKLAEGYAARRSRVPVLARGKVEEFFHRNWVCDTSGLAAATSWRPRMRFAAGVGATLGWYRDAGWL